MHWLNDAIADAVVAVDKAAVVGAVVTVAEVGGVGGDQKMTH